MILYVSVLKTEPAWYQTHQVLTQSMVTVTLENGRDTFLQSITIQSSWKNNKAYSINLKKKKLWFKTNLRKKTRSFKFIWTKRNLWMTKFIIQPPKYNPTSKWRCKGLSTLNSKNITSYKLSPSWWKLYLKWNWKLINIRQNLVWMMRLLKSNKLLKYVLTEKDCQNVFTS